ncbi:MAG: GAF domain-containing protein [Nitrosospira sp.]|nr:GAF domain-containing protein [Nitrosospira sp.]
MAEDDPTGAPELPRHDKPPGLGTLSRRPSRAPDFEAENLALVALAYQLATHPFRLFQELSHTALNLCRAGSAGINILKPDGHEVRLDACAGILASYAGTTLSRFTSPSGLVAAYDAPTLCEDPASFPPASSNQPPVTEALLLPFHYGEKPAGNLWVAAHSPERKFDGEDLRLMTSLSNFASAACQLTSTADGSASARDILERKVEERTEELSLANKTLQYQVSERVRTDEALRAMQQQLEFELASLSRLHELSMRLLNIPDLGSALKEILQAAIDLRGADMGYIRLYDPVRKVLSIAAHQGFKDEFIELFGVVDGNDDSPCARAIRTRQRVMIEDVLGDKQQPVIQRSASEMGNYRAIQSTPLFSREGKALGVLSTHFRFPHVPDGRGSRMLDLYARQAADFIESLRITEHLRDADRRKDEFIATLSHELRNPLAAIDGVAVLLQSPGLDSARQEWAVQVVRRQCRSMRVMLDDLLDVSRLSLERVTLRRQRITLDSIIETAIETTQHLLDEANHSLSVTRLPASVMVYGDPVRLAQVFSNLLSNAAKYMDAGGKIAVDMSPTADGVLVSVTDNGIGIEPSCIEEIFDMFSQAKARRQQTSGGLGIGLALVRTIAELHGGWVYATSSGIGQGSTFYVRLPTVDSEEIFAPPPAKMPDPSSESGSRPRYRILVADDNEAAAMAISMLLQRDEHETRMVHDGEAAIHEAERFQPHIALLDIGMPHLSGYEVARIIRAAPWGANMRLIAATGWGQEKDKKLAEEAGFNAHLTKPIEFKQLLALLEEQGNNVACKLDGN